MIDNKYDPCGRRPTSKWPTLLIQRWNWLSSQRKTELMWASESYLCFVWLSKLNLIVSGCFASNQPCVMHRILEPLTFSAVIQSGTSETRASQSV